MVRPSSAPGSSWISFLLVLLVIAITTHTVEAAVTVCPKVGSIETGLQYHASCDRVASNTNDYKRSVRRHFQYQAFKALGGIAHVPNQHTVQCPAGGARVSMNHNHNNNAPLPTAGIETVFFIENQATTPIVLAYVVPQQQQQGGGMEVSARNPHISPASADPETILQPGAWMAVYTTEGHEFVARQLLKSGAAGNVLLQHRAGLIPVGSRNEDWECPVQDVEPLRNDTIAPEFARTAPPPLRPCHTMDVGFRNVASCPLHAYYVHGEGDSCQERFKFHLGVQQTELDDYMWQWQSATKYEGTFVGHTFHFRLASNPTILVDTVTLRPVIVTDCPTDQVAVPVHSRSGGTAIPNSLPQRNGNHNNNSANTTMWDYAGRNTTTPMISLDGTLHSL